ncbi:unnamed protein product [Didymodactylos carnosus]|uniref:Uncharacterized protein n=1 Tax=Didymodactylos carnosus TaxID=1234261 RepID=A0A814HR59_9BILA|nr:unnamed protein product [Didymodactylos carnosus]CAF1012811.1 unnamed protein product [Didymodactylos carnosus]CAF3625205.1 unnamed protein product [Didymodactylos carnosus]CAF3784189.1 unnamed protein product [Didymodactylos carnosus]
MMFEKAQIVLSRLEEISDVNVKYPRIFSCFSGENVYERWKKELSRNLIELSDEIVKLQNTEVLNTKLLIVRAFSRLDGFSQGEKYINLDRHYQEKVYTQTSEVCKQVIDAIKSNANERVSVEMMTLYSSNVSKHFSKEVKRALNIGLSNLIDETKNQAIMLGDNTELQQIKSIIKNLKIVQIAKQFVSQYLDSQNDVDDCVKEVKKIISDRIIRFSEEVEVLIIINNFYETDKKLYSVTLIRTFLGSYCTKEAFDKIEAYNNHHTHTTINNYTTVNNSFVREKSLHWTVSKQFVYRCDSRVQSSLFMISYVK